jgi:hypothetical protein
MTAPTPRICNAPRTDGRLCKSPSMHDKLYCYYHQRDHDRRRRIEQNLDHRRSCIANENFYELHCEMPDKSSYDDNLAGLFSDLGAPLLDDGNAIAQQLSTVFYGLATHQIPQKKAWTMIFNLQVAMSNLKNVRPPDTQYDSCATEDPNPIQLMPGLEAIADRALERAKKMAEDLAAKKAANGTEG